MAAVIMMLEKKAKLPVRERLITSAITMMTMTRRNLASGPVMMSTVVARILRELVAPGLVRSAIIAPMARQIAISR